MTQCFKKVWEKLVQADWGIVACTSLGNSEANERTIKLTKARVSQWGTAQGWFYLVLLAFFWWALSIDKNGKRRPCPLPSYFCFPYMLLLYQVHHRVITGTCRFLPNNTKEGLLTVTLFEMFLNNLPFIVLLVSVSCKCIENSSR